MRAFERVYMLINARNTSYIHKNDKLPESAGVHIGSYASQTAYTKNQYCTAKQDLVRAKSWKPTDPNAPLISLGTYVYVALSLRQLDVPLNDKPHVQRKHPPREDRDSIIKRNTSTKPPFDHFELNCFEYESIVCIYIYIYF